MKLAARTAVASDAPEVRAIAEALADEIRDERGGFVHLAEQRALLEGHLVALARDAVTHDAAAIFVVELDDCIVGFAALRIRAHDALRIGVIDAYGVLADARGIGAGETLLAAVIDRCRDAGCAGIDADALPGARETKNFFETFGFTARRLVVHHRLDRADP